MSENKSFFDANPAMLFVFGLVTGIALTMIFSNVSLNDSSINNKDIAVQEDSGDDNDSGPVLAAVDDNDHVRGNLDKAEVVIVEYSDFECPYCGRHHPTMKKIMEEYGDKVAWVYRHFPLTNIHKNAQSAALASECAAEQGKFWEYADSLFDNQKSLGDDLYTQIAQDLNLDLDQFNDCYDNQKYLDKIKNDYSSGVAAGVTGTPANFINGQKVSGAVPYENMAQIIDSYLK
ncbi:DsbA family protein [Candidatus Parcubacteria bacterium]|nr:MAG: DsbA family protein [Candidatus Parcubacteria bacterium]